ncbi:DUF3306 domain-containing protein [Algirhabdus cladophorae]|uniref:DUF3306 domain-containing protein n=1 Tax=Algirhabdus cladophorae TaxID=3377108 RepID=UPI003B84B733
MSERQDFWSRRKARVAAEAEEQAAAVEAQTLADERAALEEKTDAEILAELDLPDPDAMQQGDDFSVFMSKAVPDRLRRRALRTLWRSNPVLANVDMLVDYGEDFTDSATVIENLQTAYQVGKGMLTHVQEMARKAEELADVTGEADGDEVQLADAPQAASSHVDEPEVETATVSVEADTETEAPAPRRMKFYVKESAA